MPQNNGSLILNGSLGDEIIFQGYRTEEWYQDMPGQWGFIYFASDHQIIPLIMQ